MSPYRRLAGAVIQQACKYAAGNVGTTVKNSRKARTEARAWLETDMAPFAEIIDLDPETDLAFRTWLRKQGLRPLGGFV